jgi:hypothetical protein
MLHALLVNLKFLEPAVNNKAELANPAVNLQPEAKPLKAPDLHPPNPRQQPAHRFLPKTTSNLNSLHINLRAQMPNY